MKLNILVVPSWYPAKNMPLNGIFFLEQCIALKEAGHNVQVIVPPQIDIRDQLVLQKINFKQSIFERYKGIHTIRLVKGKKKIPLIVFFLLRRKIQRPDIIHAHGILHGGRLAVFFAEKWKIPVVLTEHSSVFVTNNKIIEKQIEYIREILKKISSILVVGESLKEVLRSIVPDRNIKIVGNPVDTSFFTIPQLPKKKTTFIFSVVALFSENKGIDIIIKSFAQAFIDRDNIFLFIGGNGSIIENLKELSVTLKVDKKIFFLGELSREGVRELLWKSHVHVSASYFETFGINMIEALSCGVPVIATKSGGPELFINSSNGLLVDKGNINNLSSAMSYIYDNYEIFNSIAIRNECKNKFGIKNYIKKIITIYNSVLNNK